MNLIKRLFLLTILLLTSCSTSEDKLHFSGESDIWHVQYEATNIEEEKRISQFSIKYIGNDAAPKKMRYALNGETFHHSGEARSEKGIETVNREGADCSKCIHFQENENIIATIRWQGEKEEIRLLPEK